MRLHIFIPFALGPTVHDDVGGEGGLVALDEPAGQEFLHCSPRRAEYLHWGKAEARRVEYLHRSLCGAEQNHLNRLCGCFSQGEAVEFCVCRGIRPHREESTDSSTPHPTEESVPPLLAFGDLTGPTVHDDVGGEEAEESADSSPSLR